MRFFVILCGVLVVWAVALDGGLGLAGSRVQVLHEDGASHGGLGHVAHVHGDLGNILVHKGLGDDHVPGHGVELGG